MYESRYLLDWQWSPVSGLANTLHGVLLSLCFTPARPDGDESMYRCHSWYQTFGFLLLLVGGLELLLQTLLTEKEIQGVSVAKVFF